LCFNVFILYYSKKPKPSYVAARPAPAVTPAADQSPKTVKCLHCGSPLSVSAKFCPECGTKAPNPVPPGMVICPKCGNTVSIGKYCSVCGHCFDESPSPSRSSKLEHAMKSQYSRSEMDQIVYQEMKTPSKLKKIFGYQNDDPFDFITLTGILLGLIAVVVIILISSSQ
jgi:hypothetical protein